MKICPTKRRKLCNSIPWKGTPVFLANEASVRLFILLTCHVNLIAEETVKSVRPRSNESKAGYQLDITVILLDPVIWVFKIQFYKE